MVCKTRRCFPPFNCVPLNFIEISNLTMASFFIDGFHRSSAFCSAPNRVTQARQMSVGVVTPPAAHPPPSSPPPPPPATRCPARRSPPPQRPLPRLPHG